MTPSDNNKASGVSAWLDRNARVVAIAGLTTLLVGSGLVLASAMSGEDGSPDEASPSADTATDVGHPAEAALVAVKIDNAPAARPQIGLASARFVIETPVEGGMTRFLAFFESAPNLVGPVRSVRPVDADLVGMLAGSLVSTGGQPFVLAAFDAAGIAMLGFHEFGPALEVLERPEPHHLFFRLSEAEPTPRPLGIPIGVLPEGDDEALSMTIPYTAPVEWGYDGSVYVRSEAGQQFMVAVDENSDPSPFGADSVVVMMAAERLAGYHDAAGADVPTFDVIGAGDLLVFHGGRVVAGRWSRSAQADPYVFRDPTGAAFGVPEGRVFIHVVARDADVAH
ncbi:hypothetical protein BH23ACT5_BH23ACT5_15810 [soil metagenome]